MKHDPVNSPAAQSPGPHPSPMESDREDPMDEFERVEHIDDTVQEDHETPAPQTWKHPDDGKSLSEGDEEVPLKP